jgi:flagellar biosynthetic protein FlhB
MGLIRSTALAGLALAAADYAFQRRRVKKGMMMTKQEVKEEYRQSEGDPMTRQRIRQRQVEMSRNRMMAAVAVSSVVVVNPTHIAVALEYSAELGAPRVVAKGQGHIAARIREEAEKHNVPIVRDVPLARTLHAACKLGQTIPADLYEAVARLLAFVFSMKRTA